MHIHIYIYIHVYIHMYVYTLYTVSIYIIIIITKIIVIIITICNVQSISMAYYGIPFAKYLPSTCQWHAQPEATASWIFRSFCLSGEILVLSFGQVLYLPRNGFREDLQ